ncbi:MAG TPA: GNAT family N-acetyltransferase [Bacilli bacterium]|nr:GNAT family N-acetyltransferase [Bacilli bacterium]
MIKPVLASSVWAWLLKHWNEEFHNSFPLSQRLGNEKVIQANPNYQGDVFTYELKGEVVGVLILKYYLRDDFPKNLYLSLLYVLPTKRHQGVGGQLLNFAIAYAKKHGFRKVITGSDPSCLFSGVFINHNPDVHAFFQKRHFTEVYKNMNLICVNKPQTIHSKMIRIVASEAEKQAVLAMIKQHFSKRWWLDVRDAQWEELIMMQDQGQVIGFLRLSHESFKQLANSMNLHQKYQHLGGIGPLGIIPFYRGRGLGKQIVQWALNHLFQMGCSEVIVDWTGLVSFYQGCGFSHISQEYIIYQYETEVG